MQFIKGPDFPTGGIVLGRGGIYDAYTTGRGRIIVRAKTEIEQMTAQPQPHPRALRSRTWSTRRG